MRKLVTLLFFALAAQLSWAQCKEYKWPADKAKAEEQLAIYGDAIKQQNYRGAAPGIQWFLMFTTSLLLPKKIRLKSKFL
jgi:hypothetical protein